MKYAISLLTLVLAAVVSSPCFAESDYQIKSSDESSILAMDRNRLASSYSRAELDSLPKVKEMGLSIIVKPDLAREKYEEIINKAISDIRSKDSDIDQIFMLVYDSDYEALDPFSVASVKWCPNEGWGSVTPNIAISNDRAGYKTNIEWADKYKD